MEDYYDILKIDKNADKKEIKRAYVKLLRKYPPETNPEEFKKIRKAYEVLSDDRSKAEYNLRFKNESEIPLELAVIFNNSNFKKYIHTTNAANTELDINSETDFREVIRIVKSYCRNNDYSKAIDILNLAINKDNPECSKNILYHLERIQIYIQSKNKNQMSSVLDDLIKIGDLGHNSDLSRFILKELKRIYVDLYYDRKYSYCKIFLDKLIDVIPNSKDLKYEIRILEKCLRCRDNIDLLIQDEKVSKCLKIIIEIWLNEDLNSEEEKAKLKYYKEELEKTKGIELVKSINRLKKHYPNFYEINSIYFFELNNKIKKASLLIYLYSLMNAKRIAYVLFCLIIIIPFAFSLKNQHTSKIMNNYKADYDSSRSTHTTHIKIKTPGTLVAGYSLKKENYMDNKDTNNILKDALAKITYSDGQNEIYYDVFIRPNSNPPYKIDWTQSIGGNQIYYEDNDGNHLVCVKLAVESIMDEDFEDIQRLRDCNIYYRFSVPYGSNISVKDLETMLNSLK